MSIVLYLPGIALSAVTGMNVYVSILIMGLLSTAYTVLGGMKAVIWTDVIQGFVLVFGAILCIVVAIFSLDGNILPYYTSAFQAGKFNMGEVMDWDLTTASLWVVVFGNIFYRLSTYTSDQSIVQRYMVTPSIEKAQKASWTSLFLLVPWSIIVFTLGTTLFIYYKENPAELNPIVNTDAVLPWFISQKMPIGLGGLIIAAIFAAAMSSLDSAMHSTSTVIVTDFYKRFIPDSSDSSQLILAKWLIGVFGVLGTAISLLMVAQNYISIWDVFIEFTGLFGGITAGLFFLGVFTIRGNSTGALVGIAGSICTMFLVKGFTNVHILLYGAISLITCFLLGYVSSLFLNGKSNITDLTIFRITKK
jgi:SSS family transporter